MEKVICGMGAQISQMRHSSAEKFKLPWCVPSFLVAQFTFEGICTTLRFLYLRCFFVLRDM